MAAARRELAAVRGVRVRVAAVDTALTAFGLDTAGLRESIEAKLTAAGLRVGGVAADVPAAELLVDVSLTARPTPATDPGVVLGLHLVRPGRTASERRVLWTGGASGRAPSYRMLAELAGQLAEQEASRLTAAYHDARGPRGR